MSFVEQLLAKIAEPKPPKPPAAAALDAVAQPVPIAAATPAVATTTAATAGATAKPAKAAKAKRAPRRRPSGTASAAATAPPQPSRAAVLAATPSVARKRPERGVHPAALGGGGEGEGAGAGAPASNCTPAAAAARQVATQRRLTLLQTIAVGNQTATGDRLADAKASVQRAGVAAAAPRERKGKGTGAWRPPFAGRAPARSMFSVVAERKLIGLLVSALAEPDAWCRS